MTHGAHLGDNALISVFPSGKKTPSGKKELIVHTETLSGTYRIDPETLETLGRVEYSEMKSSTSGSTSGEKDTTAAASDLLKEARTNIFMAARDGVSSDSETDSDDTYLEQVSGMIKTAHPYVLPNGDVINLACDFMPVASKAAGMRLWVSKITI